MILGTFSLPNVNIAYCKAVVELGCAQSTLAAFVALPCIQSAVIFSGHEHRQLYRLWVASRPTHLLEVQ